jgi:hypothetical protein
MRCNGLALILLTLFVMAVYPPAAQAAAVQIVRVPDGGIQPQLQMDQRGRLHLIYFKGDPKHGDILYVRSDDGGSTFTQPLAINSQPGSAIAIGTVRGPHLALGAKGCVHVAWMGSSLAEPKVHGQGAPMLYTRLIGAGTGFEPQRNVIQQHPGLDGGGAVAADDEGNVYVAWHAPAQGKQEEADRHVWLARSHDGGKTFAAEIPALTMNTGAGACCGMNIIASADGRVYILFRSASQTVHRDMHLLVSNDHGQSFEVLATDPWTIGTCVMSTSAFARSPHGRGVLAAWETQDQIHFAQVQAGALSAVGVQSVPGTARRKHPAVAVNARGEFIVAWAEGTGWNKGGTVAWQVFNPHGKPEAGQSGRRAGLPPWDAPAAFADPDGGFKIVF